MKHFCKTLIAVCALAIASLSAIAQQSPLPVYNAPKSLDMTGIATIAGATTQTCTNLYIDCRRSQQIALQATFAFANTTTSNVVYTFSKSLDKVNWETFAPFVWTIAGNSTTPVTSLTNITVGGIGWLKLNSIQNTHATIVLTNTAVIYSDKRNSP